MSEVTGSDDTDISDAALQERLLALQERFLVLQERFLDLQERSGKHLE